MNGIQTHVGFVTPTTPPSSTLDTLKALVLRNIDHLEYVMDRLSGGAEDIPEDILQFLDSIKKNQYEAIAEHVHVARDERLQELCHLHPNAYQYDDGSPVVERFESKYMTSTYYPRYNGDRTAFIAKHNKAAARYEERLITEDTFNRIVGIDHDEEDG